MLQKFNQDEGCLKCYLGHCINKHSGHSNPDKSCFVKSGCADCRCFSICISPNKDQAAFDLDSRFVGNDKIPLCFVQPTSCNECYKCSHCKNKYLEAFKLNVNDPLTPTCFSRYHSTK